MNPITTAGKILSLALVVLFCAAFQAKGPVAASRNQPGQDAPTRNATDVDKDLNALRVIGNTIVRAILDKDTAVLLSYEDAAARDKHRIELGKPGNDFYCFLVRVSPACLPAWKDSLAVLDKLATARRPSVLIEDYGVSKLDGARRASLFFFDSAAIAQADVRSPAFYCGQGGWKKMNEWTFKLVEGEWKTDSRLFNYSNQRCGSNAARS